MESKGTIEAKITCTTANPRSRLALLIFVADETMQNLYPLHAAVLLLFAGISAKFLYNNPLCIGTVRAHYSSACSCS